jgi:SAM domain (Sterile alpha motif)
MEIPVRMRQTRMLPGSGLAPQGFKCQTRSTSASGSEPEAEVSSRLSVGRIFSYGTPQVAWEDGRMQQIADWLEKLDLGQYAQRFADNGIDVSVLSHLTDQDLEKVGVLLGHRRKNTRAHRPACGRGPSNT